MGMGFHRAGSVRAPARSHRPGVGWSVGVSAAIRPSRGRPPAAVHRWPASASRRAAPGRESGAADAGERRTRGGASSSSPHRSKTRPGDFAREQQSVIWSLPAFSSAVSTLSRCSGIPSRTPVIQEPHIPVRRRALPPPRRAVIPEQWFDPRRPAGAARWRPAQYKRIFAAVLFSAAGVNARKRIATATSDILHDRLQSLNKTLRAAGDHCGIRIGRG